MEILYRSTRSDSTPITASQAILRGFPEDGGLYVPTTVPKLETGLAQLAEMDYRGVAYEVMRLFLTDYTQEELMKESDIISIHVPVLPSTINMINRETLSMMKNDVLLVNVARGEIVNNDDLAWALEAQEIGFAALDTVAPEPMPDDHPLRNLRPDADARVLFTTHSAGRTDQAFKRMLEWAIASMKKMENGERPNNIVNGL